MWVSCNQRFYILMISLGVLAIVLSLPSCYPELPDDPVCFLDGDQLQNQSFSDQSVQSNRCCDSTQVDSAQKCVDFFTTELTSKAIPASIISTFTECIQDQCVFNINTNNALCQSGRDCGENELCSVDNTPEECEANGLMVKRCALCKERTPPSE